MGGESLWLVSGTPNAGNRPSFRNALFLDKKPRK